MKAVDIRTRPVITSSPDASLEEIASLMPPRKIGCVPIVDEHGRLCGIVTESDFSAKVRGVPFSTLKLPALFAAWLPKEPAERLFEAARRCWPSATAHGPDCMKLSSVRRHGLCSRRRRFRCCSITSRQSDVAGRE